MDKNEIEFELFDGLKLSGVRQKKICMRPFNAGDMIDAEDSAPVTKQLAYNTALAALIIKKFGTFDGTVTYGMLRRLSPRDLNLVHSKLGELEAIAGED